MDLPAKITLILLSCFFAGFGCSSNGSPTKIDGTTSPETDLPLLGQAVDGTPVSTIESVDPNVINGFALTGIFEQQDDGSRLQLAEISIDYESRVYRVNPDDLIRKSFWWNVEGQLSGSRHGASSFYETETFHYDDSRHLSLVEYEADNISTIRRNSTYFQYSSSGLPHYEVRQDDQGNQVGRHRYIWLSNIGGFVWVNETDENPAGDFSLDYSRRGNAGYMTDHQFFPMDPLNDIQAIDIFQTNDSTPREPKISADFDEHGNIIRLTSYIPNADGNHVRISSILEFDYEWAGFPILNLPLHVLRHQPMKLLSLLDFILY